MGDDAADYVAQFGMVMDPWQCDILRDWMAVGEDDKWASRTCGLAVPRQNGKNAVLEARELFGMIQLGERFLHSAHEVETAMKHFRRMMRFFGKRADDPDARFPALNALVSEVRRGNGKEAIFLKNGGSIEMRARSKSASRGYSVDVVVYDEAQEFSEDSLEALNGTNSASPNKQHIYLGTPPGPNATGAIWRRQRATAVGDEPGARCWSEWSVVGQLGVDFDVADRETWTATNPGRGIRIEDTTIEDELKDMSPAGFARERLGWWGPDDDGTEMVFPTDQWAALISDGPPDGTRPTALAVDMSHDRLAAVGACWAEGDRAHVELVALDYASDTLAVVETVAGMARHLIPVVIDQWSPASALAGPLKQRRVKVVMTSSGGDMARACGLFLDDLTAGRLTHADQEQLDQALAGAKRRKIGDAGGWGLDRRDPDQNIAPLVAVVLARHGAATGRPKTGRGRVMNPNRRGVSM